MRNLFLIALSLLFSVFLLSPVTLRAQSPPADFAFSASTGGVAPLSDVSKITVDNNGQAKYTRSVIGPATAILADTTFAVSSSALQALWKNIQDSSFFSVAPTWIDTTVHDGMYVRMAVTANGVTHIVSVTNVDQPTIEGILSTLNAAVPTSLQLHYYPPRVYDTTPKDPCPGSGAALGKKAASNPRLESSRSPKQHALLDGLGASATPPQGGPSHPGVVVAYDVDLQQAINRKLATLKSKGNFFGDDVSVTINDNDIPPPSNTINITMFLEFWGPLATQEVADQIEASISKYWQDLTNSKGQKIQIGFDTRLNPGATEPPNTPGYDEIHLLNPGAMGYEPGSNYGANYGTASVDWEVDEPAGYYAQQAGLLMGLKDQSDSFYKQPDGSWVDPQSGQRFNNDDDFAAYVQTKYPGSDLNNIKKGLQNTDQLGVPRDPNDLMGDIDGSLTQAEIDQVTRNPGLLVYFPDGIILVNRDNTAQNLIVVHKDWVFAGVGEQRTLNGIYAACIDHHKGIPDAEGVFDVAPPISEWNGIRAAGYLQKLLHYVDSVGLYCLSNFATQELIWRISDNMPLLDDPQADSILSAAGISITNEMFDFPRITGGNSTDSASHLFLPDQLYKADIQPLYASGQVGTASSFTATVLHPSGTPAPVGISWTAIGPDGAPVPINGTDSTASFTPSKSGVYQIGLNMSMNDSLHGLKTLSPDQKAYVIVPDQYTETFEHPGLTDKYPWQSYGDVPWTITNSNPETGTNAAEPGIVTGDQISTLGIDVSLPADSVIVFSVRSFIGVLLSHLTFSVDSVYVDSYHNGSDWQAYKYPIRAGKHRLTWSFSTPFEFPGESVWLDNIFFPGNVVVTSVGDKAPDLPTVFALEQNYPNPFNPATIIKYAVAGDRGSGARVKIVVYDVLGREVETLVDEVKAPGYYTAQFDGRRLASGVYFYRMTAGDFVQTRKLTLLK